MSNDNSDLRDALDSNNIITIGEKVSSSKSHKLANSLPHLKSLEIAPLPNDPIGIEYFKYLSPEVFICSSFILERLHSLPFLSKKARYNLESIWSDFQTGQIHNYQSRVTTLAHPKNVSPSDPHFSPVPLDKVQDIIDTLAYLLHNVPDQPQTWTTLENIKEYFASSTDQRQLRQQWAKTVVFPSTNALFIMVGTVLLDSLTNLLSDVKNDSELKNISWDHIKEDFKAGKFETTRKIVQKFVKNQAIVTEDAPPQSSPSNDIFLSTIFNVLYSFLP